MHTINTPTLRSRSKAEHFSEIHLGSLPFSQGSTALGSLTWLFLCQQYRVAQAFPLYPTIIVLTFLFLKQDLAGLKFSITCLGLLSAEITCHHAQFTMLLLAVVSLTFSRPRRLILWQGSPPLLGCSEFRKVTPKHIKELQ